MIASISDITMSDFISLMCGNLHVLLEDDERYDEEECRKTASKMIYKYNSIVNPAGVQTALFDISEEMKAKTKNLIADVLKTMLAIGSFDDVGIALSELGYGTLDPKEMSDAVDRMKAESRYLLKRVEDNRPQKKPRSEDDIRSSYDEQSAMLMTFFRMQIDLKTVSAGVYANMLHQADMQIKRMARR